MSRPFASVQEFLDAQAAEPRGTVDALRALIKEAEPALAEGIKWNSPSYALGGRDCITFSVRPGKPVLVVFHTGTEVQEKKKGAPVLQDSTGMLSWRSDIRATAEFVDSAAVKERAADVQWIVRAWSKIVNQ